MCKENIDYKRLCDAIGITEGIAKEFAKMECISTLVDDIYTYANYEEIAMERADRHVYMEDFMVFVSFMLLRQFSLVNQKKKLRLQFLILKLNNFTLKKMYLSLSKEGVFFFLKYCQ